MGKSNASILKLVNKVLDSKTKKAKEGWPPECGGLFHQPKRPELNK